MIGEAAAPEAEFRSTEKKILEVGRRDAWQRSRPCGRIGEEQFAIEYLRKILVQIHAGEFAAKAEHMRALDPAHGVHKVEVVLVLRLVAERRRSDLESRALENELIDRVRNAVRRPVDSQVTCGDRRHVAEHIVDMHEAEPEFIYECGRKEMRLRDIQKPGFYGRIEREIQRRRADAAGKCAPKRLLQVAATEGKKTFRVGKEKTRGKFILAAAEFAVPVGRELVVRIFPGTAYGERARQRIAAGNQESVRRPAELVALKIQQFLHHRIDRRRRISEKGLRNRSLRPVRRKRGDRRADERARRITAFLPRALVVQEKVAEFLLYHRSAKTSAEDILIDLGTSQPFTIQEEIVGVQNRVAEEFVGVAMELPCAGLQNRVDVSAAVASLAGVIERRLDFELLDHVGIGQRNVSGLRNVVVCGADSFDQKVVVVLTLAVHKQFYAAASKLRGGV